MLEPSCPALKWTRYGEVAARVHLSMTIHPQFIGVCDIGG